MVHSRLSRSLLWLSLLGFLASGCATLDMEPPELSLVDLRPIEATLFETTLLVRLRLANPNPEALTFDGASFRLELDGRKVGRGMTAESLTVERFGSEILDVTLHVNNASLALRLQQIMQAKTVTYGLTGKLYVQQEGRSPKLEVQSAGRFDLAARSADPAPLDIRRP